MLDPMASHHQNTTYLRGYQPRAGSFLNENGEAFYNIEVVKTLILYGEMEPILRVCVHPDVDYKSWQSQCLCFCMVNTPAFGNLKIWYDDWANKYGRNAT